MKEIFDILQIERQIIRQLDNINYYLKSIDLTTLNDNDLLDVKQSIEKIWLILRNKKEKQISEKWKNE